MPEIAELQRLIGYTFKDTALLERALTHPSYGQDSGDDKHYQRLEFLGDAVLGLILAEELFRLLPEEREGALTRYRSMLARGEQLSGLARQIGLGLYLRIGAAEEANGGRERASILEDAFEALIGALYVDGGLEVARDFVTGLFDDLLALLDRQLVGHNPKGRLQELLQPSMGNEAIEYRILDTDGPDHAKTFRVEVWIDGKAAGQGSGASKKAAEEAAAREALNRLAGGGTEGS